MFEHWLFQRRKQGLTREGKSKSRPALVAFNSHGKRISVQKRIENEVLLQPRNNERRKNKRDISTDSTRSPLLLRKLWLGSPSTNLVCVLLSAFGLWALSSNSSQNSHGQVGRQDRQASLPSAGASNRASREHESSESFCNLDDELLLRKPQANKKKNSRISNHQAKGPCCAAHRDCTGPPSCPEIVRLCRERSDGVVSDVSVRGWSPGRSPSASDGGMSEQRRGPRCSAKTII